jgi:BolA family transcriptional regulator, general stress-responsive regulator
MKVRSAIEEKLSAGLKPTRLTIIDESHRHAGHAGARPEGETHFRVEVVSPAFAGLGRVQRQRLVYELLADELKGPVHALALVTRTPEEERAKPAAG